MSILKKKYLTQQVIQFVFSKLQVTEEEYVNTGYTITLLKKLELPEYDNDILVCTGHFNAIHIYLDGKVGYQSMTMIYLSVQDISMLYIFIWMER